MISSWVFLFAEKTVFYYLFCLLPLFGPLSPVGVCLTCFGPVLLTALHFIYHVRLAQWLARPPLVDSRHGQVTPKTIIKMEQTASLHGTHVLVRSLTVQYDCLNSWVVCGNVYWDMHLDLLESIARVGYIISVLDFYLVLHGLRC